ncbi:DNA-binding protein [Bacillus cereus]|nr:DNA-binding protein [Bacillus cereus]PFE41151.1 DNA-binding protein [Bacillus cereus]PFN17494.1 DNA-binding protein [Bacillus cereus]PGY30229.1 DNA-binding protein [Bacillus cereus]
MNFFIIGKGLLWIYKKLFPKKYYILIFRGIQFRCIVYPLQPGIGLLIK